MNNVNKKQIEADIKKQVAAIVSDTEHTNAPFLGNVEALVSLTRQWNEALYQEQTGKKIPLLANTLKEKELPMYRTLSHHNQQCPVDGEFLIRQSDDVCDYEQWTICYVRMHKGRSVDVKVVWDGIYGTSHFLDKSWRDIQEKLDHDPTGQHPEHYTEMVEFREDSQSEKDFLNDVLAVWSPTDNVQSALKELEEEHGPKGERLTDDDLPF